MRFRRVIHNIATNACEAMANGGCFTISVDEQKDRFLIMLSDTGPGIPQDIRDDLFEPFVTTGKYSGTGLGLAMVKKIIDEHGGLISFKTSEKGTAFLIELPVKNWPEEVAIIKRTQ